MKKLATVLGIAILSISTSTVWADGTGLTLSGFLSLYSPDQTPLRPTGTITLTAPLERCPGGMGIAILMVLLSLVRASSLESAMDRSGDRRLRRDHGNSDRHLYRLRLRDYGVYTRDLQSIYNRIFDRFR